MYPIVSFLLFLFLPALLLALPIVELGVDRFFKENYAQKLQGKKIGLITNQTGVNSELKSTIDLFCEPGRPFTLTALFAPEHGIHGQAYAAEKSDQIQHYRGIPVYSLYGQNSRPSDAMLEGIDLLIFDIQDIGCRSYTYVSTLCSIMEVAAAKKIPLYILDRPNPINGLTVDGPMLSPDHRSFLAYLDIPYCYGMTIGELARYFNAEYQIGCPLTIVPLNGWKRSMTFADTGLTWIPPSPQIPEADTPFFYASTGILGELGIANIGVGYTLPFKVVGAPWINAEIFAEKLNVQHLSGVHFIPFHYRPFFGSFKSQNCQGVKILITDPLLYRPLSVQYLILGMLKSLYPQKFQEKLAALEPLKKKLFCQVSGNSEMLTLISQEKYIAWKLIDFQKEERAAFLKKREKYLLY